MKGNENLLEALKHLVSNVTVQLDSHWRVRMKWLELCTLLAQNKLQKWTQMITNLARKDEDEDVRREAVRSLIILITSEDKLPSAIKTMLSNIDISALDADRRVRMEWVELFCAMTQKKFYNFLTAVIKMSTEDHDEDVRLKAMTSLASLLESDGMLSLMPIIHMYIEIKTEKAHESFVKIISSNTWSLD
ncbi:hypothetical protein BDQ17DRAFT_846477 [Cyathus striatus]|nr:hypothetical protein BDQ17DRAFT_846477 [Cyathus striatus]